MIPLVPLIFKKNQFINCIKKKYKNNDIPDIGFNIQIFLFKI